MPPILSSIIRDEIKPIDGASDSQLSAIDGIAKEFDLTVEKLSEIVNHFCNEMDKGLEKSGMTVAMIPSFVTGIPTGNEVGTFLALDLGGTNLRICEIAFEGKGVINVKQQKHKVTENLKTGPANQLFDFIADCIDKFLSELVTVQFENDQSENDKKFKMGFTFSFPVEQTAINKGTLIKWTKGFTCPDAENKDVVFMLQEALKRKEVPVVVAALVNDTVGTLLSHSYKDPDTLIGIIYGTGTNGAYFEDIPKIKKLNKYSNDSEKMIINIEWGAFDSEKKVLPLTMFDNKLDRESNNPHYQIFEKMISGMYLGEITRNILLHLIDRMLLFDGYSSKELNRHYSFETEYMSTIEADESHALDDTKKVLEELLNIPSTTLTDRQIVKRVCQIVALRAARLSSATLAAIITHCGRVESGSSVGIDGSLFEFYPHFSARIKTALQELFGTNADKIKISLARDGSGVGAALAAMLTTKK
ncbi:22136_t:CDS:2 [Dentiscutata erythropus]|uniref:Phosphotransferase n=1 Tax=Dentiscutata erythropus TaxID=1348616 RepID=A0A9N9CKB7_9GLOM|nr:22136_t:CDS:2 [Dentiscutata erythropus]